VDEMGRNSVSPSTSPMMVALISNTISKLTPSKSSDYHSMLCRHTRQG
jgi:hypothetical protein